MNKLVLAVEVFICSNPDTLRLLKNFIFGNANDRFVVGWQCIGIKKVLSLDDLLSFRT